MSSLKQGFSRGKGTSLEDNLLNRSTIILLLAALIAIVTASFICAIDSLLRERRRMRERERQVHLEEILRKRHLSQRRHIGKIRRAAPGCFKALSLDEHATPDEVLAAYRQLALDLHPDRGGDPDEFIRLHRNFEQAMAYVEGRSDSKPSKPR